MMLCSALYFLQHDVIKSFVSYIALGDTFSLDYILYDNGTDYFITDKYKMSIGTCQSLSIGTWRYVT